MARVSIAYVSGFMIPFGSGSRVQHQRAAGSTVGVGPSRVSRLVVRSSVARDRFGFFTDRARNDDKDSRGTVEGGSGSGMVSVKERVMQTILSVGSSAGQVVVRGAGAVLQPIVDRARKDSMRVLVLLGIFGAFHVVHGIDAVPMMPRILETIGVMVVFSGGYLYITNGDSRKRINQVLQGVHEVLK